jgi:hypothetical protein
MNLWVLIDKIELLLQIALGSCADIMDTNRLI